jgi:hypothetical protein
MQDNTAVGYRSLYTNTTGGLNVAVGRIAMCSNTTGAENVAVGRNALHTNTTGDSNVAMGTNALNVNTTADQNTAVGALALAANTTGYSNVAVGFCSLDSNTTGNRSVAVGEGALEKQTTGFFNTGIGNRALCNVTTGDNNIGIGVDAGTDELGSITTADNQIVIGNHNHQNAFVKIDWTVTSDERDKMNFEEVPHGLDFVNQLKPVSFIFKKSREDNTPHGPQKYGFKAQDILALEGENPIIINNDDTENLKVTNSHLFPVLVNAIQELTDQNKEMKAEIEELKKK